jgi:hypothetical protein
MEIDMPSIKIVEPTVEFITPKYFPNWEEGSVRLMEECGRVSHKSEGRMEDGSAIPFLKRIAVNMGHECYDEETDVLTVDGWKAWSEVTLHDLFATLTIDGRLEYRSAARLTHSYYEGPMYQVDSPHVDLLVTPNHKMLVCPTTTRQGRKKEIFCLIPAEELGVLGHPNCGRALNDHAQWEIKMIMMKALEMFRTLLPGLFEDLGTNITFNLAELKVLFSLLSSEDLVEGRYKKTFWDKIQKMRLLSQ